MASYSNETSLKIRKSDLVIYIVALIAFILMIIVLMSDKIGVTKRVPSLINNESSVSPSVYNTSSTNPASNTDTQAQIVTGHQETTTNNEQQVASIQNTTRSNEQTEAVPPLNRDLLNDLQRNSMRTANQNQTPENTTTSRSPEQIERQHPIVERSNSPVISPNTENSRTSAVSNQNETTMNNVSPQIVNPSSATRIRANQINSEERTQNEIERPSVNAQNRAVIRTNAITNSETGLRVVQSIKANFGDALWRIAQKYNVKTINIIKVNRFTNPNFIYPGQLINIPNK